jgi:hypothetical protein
MATDIISDGQARWLPVSDAAAVLGVSDEILRLRMSRQAIGTRTDADGRVFVRTPYDLTGYIRAGITAPAAFDESAGVNGEDREPDGSGHPSLVSETEPAQAAGVQDPKDPLQTLNEARIADLKQLHAGQITDLKATIADITDRHEAEIERLQDSHQAEMQRLVDLHNISTKMFHEQAQHTAKMEAERKTMLLEVISALNGRK